jgi:fumarate hydratase class I
MALRGNRAVAVREACKKRGGFHLGSIGGAAANLAAAFIIIDDKGNDFFKELNLG